MRERINFIDYSKGLGILFVLFGHVYCSSNIVTNWICSFHIPLFFIVSGILLNLSKCNEIKLLIQKKLKLLIVPYLFFSIINLFGYYIVDESSIIAFKNNFIKMINLFGIRALWFIPALFFAEIIFIFSILKMKNAKTRILFYAGILVFVSISSILSHSMIVVVITRTIVGMFFLGIGYYSYKIINNVNLNSYKIICLLMLSILLSQVNGKVDLWSLQFNNLFLYVFNSIVGSLAIIFITKKIKKSKVLDFLGQNTLIIMATHQLILEIILKSSIIQYLNGVMVIVLILLIEYPIIKIINRYLPFMLGKKRIKTIKKEKLNTSIG